MIIPILYSRSNDDLRCIFFLIIPLQIDPNLKYISNIIVFIIIIINRNNIYANSKKFLIIPNEKG